MLNHLGQQKPFHALNVPLVPLEPQALSVQRLKVELQWMRDIQPFHHKQSESLSFIRKNTEAKKLKSKLQSNLLDSVYKTTHKHVRKKEIESQIKI